MKQLALAFAVALAMLGGAVAISAFSSTHVAAYPNNNC
jgi:hypothetical protein